jgi:hypothetical protein
MRSPPKSYHQIFFYILSKGRERKSLIHENVNSDPPNIWKANSGPAYTYHIQGCIPYLENRVFSDFS